jgi:ferredoxin
MVKYRIEVDEEACVGCGACSATCDEGFEMKDTDKGQRAKAKKSEVDSLGCIEEAAKVCPVNAIKIFDAETGAQLL